MKLTSISVKGLFALFDHTVTLRPEGLTFIHSPNGLGKSTLVKMIYDVFRGDFDNVLQVPFQRAEFVFDDDLTLVLEPDGDGPVLTLEKNEIVTDISEPEARSLLDVTYIGPRRLYQSNLDGTYRSSISIFSAELMGRLMRAQEALDSDPWNLPDSLDGEPLDLDELISWGKELRSRMEFLKEMGLNLEVPARFRFPPRESDIRDEPENCEMLFEQMASIIDRHYRLAESISVFRDIVNSMFIGKVMKVDRDRGISVTLVDGTPLDMEKLSSGETQLLIIMYRLLFHASYGSLVILDEPEISMHISWQQRLSDILLDISRLRRLQIIIATHSPQIVHDKWDLTEELRAECA